MPTLPTLLLFTLSSLALLLIPGPSVLYVVTRSLQQGRRAGLLSVLGIQTGGLLHVLAAVLGLSALVLSSALVFSAVKYLGAAYLVYLGVRTLLSRAEIHTPELVSAQRPSRVFWQGALVNALNPKTALFFLAFLPQFVNPAHGFVALQTLGFGVLFLLLATLSDSAYALLAGSLGRRLRASPRFVRRQKYLTGGVYIALGVGTAATGHHS